MNSGSELPAAVAFGRFRVLLHRRKLLLDDRPIKLGGRAFEVLLALIEARGAVLSRDALMSRVWPGQVVEENNLEVQISTLRAVFGAERGLIRTVSRRGYQFSGELRFSATPVGGRAASAEPEPVASATNLPQPVSELIGRDDEIREILRLAAAQRLVTMTGAGGIGKTRLALAAAHRLLPQTSDGVWLADLAPLSDPTLVPAAVAAATGLNLTAGAVTAERVANALSGKQLLLLLDNCEHLIDATAIMAEALLHANPAAHVIATSREQLRAEGEHVYPVPPLTVPAADVEDETDLLKYGAILLFVERARAGDPHFMSDGRQMATLGRICRRLDGIPLAIELAAARAATLGIKEVTARLDECFKLLTGGRRTALPRHQTLRATLDWSYELLPEAERVLLRRLAIFAGPFSLEAVSAVAAGADLARSDVIESFSNLVAKSLVASDGQGTGARYRLLDTTRAYAFEKLDGSRERERIARDHAEYCRDLFERAETEWEARPTVEWLGEYRWWIDNLRAALDWAFSPRGDEVLGIALTTAAIPLWMHLSFLEECCTCVERALAVLAAAASADARREMKLSTALGASLAYTGGAVSEIEAIWARTLHLAQSLGDVEYQLCALFGLWGLKDREALALAQQFAMVAERPADRLVGDRMIGNSYHFRGDQIRARGQFERVIAEDVVSDVGLCIRLFHMDNRPWAHVFLARVLWLQGFPAQAAETAQSTIEQPRAANWARPLCLALARAACPIALWTGNLDLASDYIELLSDCSTKHGLTVWQAFGRAYEGMLFIRVGRLSEGIGVIRAALDEIGHAFSGYRVLMFLSELAAAFGRAGQIPEGLVTINKAIARAEEIAEGWIFPELLRIKGELLLLNGGDEAVAGAHDHMRQALDCARQQGALSWELRAATSLARQLHDQGRSGDALACLQPVYGRFSEGFDTADLRSARALLDTLQ